MPRPNKKSAKAKLQQKTTCGKFTAVQSQRVRHADDSPLLSKDVALYGLIYVSQFDCFFTHKHVLKHFELQKRSRRAADRVRGETLQISPPCWSPHWNYLSNERTQAYLESRYTFRVSWATLHCENRHFGTYIHKVSNFEGEIFSNILITWMWLAYLYLPSNSVLFHLISLNYMLNWRCSYKIVSAGYTGAGKVLREL